jgi:hypothetical protein
MVQLDIANTIHLIVQVNRSFDGKRRVSEILEVCGRDHDAYVTREIFKLDGDRGLVSTGIVPRFVLENRDEKLNLTEELFDPEKKVRLT